MPEPGPPGHHDDLFVIRLSRPPHCGHDRLVGEPLFIEQDELFPVAHLCGSNGHQLPRRPDLGLQQGIGRICTGLRGQTRTQVAQEGATLITREHPAVIIFCDMAQARHFGLHRVVQVRHSDDRLRIVLQSPVERDQVVAVAAHLLDRIEDRMVVGVDMAEQRILRLGVGFAPLLQFDHHVRRLTGGWMYPGQYHVSALAGQRQPVLQQHLDFAEPGFHEHVGECRDAALPSPNLRRQGPVTVLVQKVLRQEPRQSALDVGAGGQ